MGRIQKKVLTGKGLLLEAFLLDHDEVDAEEFGFQAQGRGVLKMRVFRADAFRDYITVCACSCTSLCSTTVEETGLRKRNSHRKHLAGVALLLYG